VRTLYEHAGGESALRRFIDIFYGHILADPLWHPLFGKASPGTG
jgi:hemoglobin